MKHALHCRCLTCDLRRYWPAYLLGLVFLLAGIARLFR